MSNKFSLKEFITLLNVCEDVHIWVDVTHDISPGDVDSAVYVFLVVRQQSHLRLSGETVVVIGLSVRPTDGVHDSGARQQGTRAGTFSSARYCLAAVRVCYTSSSIQIVFLFLKKVVNFIQFIKYIVPKNGYLNLKKKQRLLQFLS